MTNEGLPECDYGKQVLPLKISVPKDLSETWKVLMRGGATKVAHYPCHCCPVHSDNFAYFKVNEERCTYCVDNDNERCVFWDSSD